MHFKWIFGYRRYRRHRHQFLYIFNTHTILKRTYQVCVNPQKCLPTLSIHILRLLYGIDVDADVAVAAIVIVIVDLLNGFTLFITHTIDDRFSQIIALTIIYAYNSVYRISHLCLQSYFGPFAHIRLVLLILFAAQLNVWNKNKKKAHDFLVYLSCDLWLSLCIL